jgi:transposase
MFQDEARFGRISDPSKCWAPEGIRPKVGIQVVQEYSYVFGAVSPKDGCFDSLILPEVNTDTMNIFLTELSRRHKKEYILMFLDGAGWHRARGLKVPLNMKLTFIPPYSPELNPVEHIWEEIREKWFTNLVFKNLNAVEDKLMEALFELENDNKRVYRLTSFKWIISCL